MRSICQNQRPNLEKVINSGTPLFICDGDAHYIYNYMGVEAVARSEVQFTRRCGPNADPSPLSVLHFTGPSANPTLLYKQQTWAPWSVTGKSAEQSNTA